MEIKKVSKISIDKVINDHDVYTNKYDAQDKVNPVEKVNTEYWGDEGTTLELDPATGAVWEIQKDGTRVGMGYLDKEGIKELEELNKKTKAKTKTKPETERDKTGLNIRTMEKEKEEQRRSASNNSGKDDHKKGNDDKINNNSNDNKVPTTESKKQGLNPRTIEREKEEQRRYASAHLSKDIHQKVVDDHINKNIYIDESEYEKAKADIMKSNPEIAGADYYYNPSQNEKKHNESVKKLEKFSIYYMLVKKSYGNTITHEQCVDYAKKLMQEDSVNNNELLYSTPILRNGKIDTKISLPDAIFVFETYKYEGDYLEFYNDNDIEVTAPLAKIKQNGDEIEAIPFDKNIDYDDYIKSVSNYYKDVTVNSKKYTEEFYSKTYDNLTNICLAYFDEDSGIEDGAAAWKRANYGFGKTSSIIMKTDQFYGSDRGESSYKYMISSFTHELGHVYAESTGYFKDIDDSEEWEEIYRQVKANDPDNKLLREYAFENESECFAEATAEYFADDTYSDVYNPNDLKKLKIDIDKDGKHYDNLYDYMDDLYN